VLTDRAWVSPAQWGSGAFLAFFLGALGLAVVRKVGRLDISLAFLGAHAALNLARVLALGHEPAVFLHRMSSGALIVFAFFMISDPRSTPDRRTGRILFASLVALAAYVLQFRFFVPSAPLWALLAVSPLTPWIDACLRGTRFEWVEKGALDASPTHLVRTGPAPRLKPR
jgi:Na+-translocating ferredoxin:NAD+ oxidoreductase RnfD subunit